MNPLFSSAQHKVQMPQEFIASLNLLISPVTLTGDVLAGS